MRQAKFVSEAELAAARAAALRLREETAGKGLKYYIESYGCQMNDNDSEKLAGMLEQAGYTPAGSKSEADCILFNTCCIREHAEHKVYGNIGALKKQKEERPDLIIGVCGCMPQQDGAGEKLYKRFPFLDMVFGTHELHNFPVMLDEAYHGQRVINVRDSEGEVAEGLPIARRGSFSTNVTITYGCNNFCSYCIVPYVRGRERSRTPEAILDEVRALSVAGFKEITLLGQNVNSYQGGEADFPELLRMVHGVDGIERIRFMTSHPKDLSPGLMEAMAELPRICRHLHLPVQSGSNRILSQMNRRYTREKYMEEVQALRGFVPDIELTTDIIVGFPGETERDFCDTMELIDEVGYSAAFTFMYSPRKGTAAAAMQAQVPQEVKSERLHRLNTLQATKTRETNNKYLHTSGEVLVEGYDKKGMAYGKLSNSKMVYFPGDESMIGSLRMVNITHTNNNSLIGELVGKAE